MASKAPKEVPVQARLDLAINEYTQALSVYDSSDPRQQKPSIRRIAKYYDVVPSTMSRRIGGLTHSRQKAHDHEQRLTPEEEQALKTWILQVTEWGWPPRVSLVRHMVCEMLKEKGDDVELGVNWIGRFLHRHEELSSRFSQPLDKERTATHDAERLLRWFQLVESVVQKYDIREEDTYNMDETGTSLGSAGSMRVICPRDSLQVYRAQDGSREWVSQIECISADGRLLPMFLIFKGKRQMKAWFNVLEDREAHIALSENGWTNNVLGLEWFSRYVQVILQHV